MRSDHSSCNTKKSHCVKTKMFNKNYSWNFLIPLSEAVPPWEHGGKKVGLKLDMNNLSTTMGLRGKVHKSEENWVLVTHKTK